LGERALSSLARFAIANVGEKLHSAIIIMERLP